MDVESSLGNAGESIDDRFRAAAAGRRAIRKVFPDHWSFFLGELALYSFIVLVLTGTFLAFFFKPSMSEMTYHGSYVKLSGVTMSEAFASTLRISFDVRGGMLIRQVHHWAAIVFVAAIATHALRIFFTGAFRRPRELNWVIGTAMFALAAVEGFAGYSLPDDLLSGTGLRITEGIMLSVPVVGSYLTFFLFGGQFPGDAVIPRLYIVHVLLLPGLILALVTGHLFSVWRQGHSQWPGRRQREANEVGVEMFPRFVLKTTSLFFFVFGLLAALGTIAQINPIWLFGPYNPAISSNGSQPDWYFAFLEGSLRLMPAAEANFLGHTIEWGVLLPAVVLPLVFFVAMAGYPLAERWITGDARPHHLLDRPRNMPARTALGVAVIAMAADLQLAGGDDVIAFHLGVPVEDVAWTLRAGFFLAPLLAFVVTRHVCVALQRADRGRLRTGMAFGIAEQSAAGQAAGHVATADGAAQADGADGADGAAQADGAVSSVPVSYVPVSRPPSDDELALLQTRRPDELVRPVPRHLVPLPTPRRVAGQVRARLNHIYLLSRLEPPDENRSPNGSTDGPGQPR